MRKTILMPFLLSAVLILSVSADDFEDFIQVSAKVSNNYNRGVVTRGTRFDKEYQANLELMQTLAARVQGVIRKLQLGQDFDFPWITLELERIYRGGQERSRVPGGSKLLAHSVSPNGILRVLTDDVKALRNMKFTTEDGGSIKPSLETTRKIQEFKRFTAFFKKNYRTVFKNDPRLEDVSLKKLFHSRLLRMSQLAGILMETARQNSPDTRSRHNLRNEVDQLQKNFDALADYYNKRAGRKNLPRKNSGSRKNNRAPGRTASTRRLDGINNVNAFYAEIDVSLRNINEQLVIWEQAGLRTDPPIQRSVRSRSSDDPAAPLLQPSKNIDYSSMDQKQLNSLLQQRRQEIFRSNRSMDGFDRDAERRYLMTLSREQKRLYNGFMKDFQQQGYSAGQAARTAILKIHTQVRMENKPLPAKEVIRILKALDRDQERRQENNKDIDFNKRERGGFENH